MNWWFQQKHLSLVQSLIAQICLRSRLGYIVKINSYMQKMNGTFTSGTQLFIYQILIIIAFELHADHKADGNSSVVRCWMDLKASDTSNSYLCLCKLPKLHLKTQNKMQKMRLWVLYMSEFSYRMQLKLL